MTAHAGQQAASDLRTAGVRGDTLDAVHAVQSSVIAAAHAVTDAIARWVTAATAARKLHGELTKQTTVQETYTANPDAGSREFLTNETTGSRAMEDAVEMGGPGASSSDPAATTGSHEDDEDPAIEEDPYTDCWECDEPLDAPVPREEQAVHPECDPVHPPRYEWGETNQVGKIKRGTGEEIRRSITSPQRSSTSSAPQIPRFRTAS